MRSRLRALMVVAVLLAGMLVSFSSDKAAAEKSRKHYKFGFTEMSAGSFFDACYKGLHKQIKANGDQVIHVEGKADGNYQLGVIEDFIAQGVDLVFYNPSDAKSSAAAIKLLNDAHIPVVNFDSPVTDLSKVASFVATDNYSAGQIAGKALVKAHPKGGKIAVLDFPEANAATDRANGFLDAIKGKGFQVVAQMDAGAKPEKGLSVTEDILQAHHDLLAIFCINDECAQGAYSAIKTAGEKVEIYSVNGGPEAKAAMKKDGKNGIWKVTAAQSPIKIGIESAKVAYKILNHEKYDKQILIPSFQIDPSNIAKYGKNEWQ
jgi:ribose transport system substrate-binding protein